MTFRERYMKGLTEFDEIFELTDKWNYSDETCTLREYLGLTADEEDIWISESDEALEELMEKEKRTKIFFTDLDDTLLNSQKEVSAGNRKALDQMLAEGHHVVITTGRALSSAKKIAKKLKLYGKNCYLITFNGGQIYDTDNEKLIYSCDLPMDQVRFAFDEAKKFGIHVHTYTDEGVISESDNDDLRTYCQIQNIDPVIVEDVTKALTHNPPKVLIIDFKNTERIPEFRNYIYPLCKDHFDVFMSNPALLEMVPPGINKGNAIRFLCDYLGLPIENSVSAGDAENDLTMIEAAHVGCCMINGVDQVKAKANYITENDMDHDGVAEIINKFILS